MSRTDKALTAALETKYKYKYFRPLNCFSIMMMMMMMMMMMIVQSTYTQYRDGSLDAV